MCKFTIPQVDSNATADERRKAYFDALYNADLSEEVEKKNGLSYVSWSQAWKVMKSFYPSATYKIHTCPTTGLPYFVDPQMGIMVHTEVTADGLTYENWLPVLDFNNRSQLPEAYSIQVYDKFKKQNTEKRIEKAFSFDCNTAIQRSLCKCMAMHGLALALWTKEQDWSDDNADSQQQQKQQSFRPTPAPQHKQTTTAPAPTMQSSVVDPNATLRNAINATTEVAALVSIYLDNTQVIENNPELKNLLTTRKKALQSLNKAA